MNCTELLDTIWGSIVLEHEHILFQAEYWNEMSKRISQLMQTNCTHIYHPIEALTLHTQTLTVYLVHEATGQQLRALESEYCSQKVRCQSVVQALHGAV